MLDGYKPKAGDEQKFKDKHVIVKSKLSKPTENEAQFTAPAVKPHARGPRHGYDQGKDEEVYESIDSKTKEYAQHQKDAFDYYDMGNDKKSKYHSKKARETLKHIDKQQGAKAAQRAEKAGEVAITGPNKKLSGPAAAYFGEKKKMKEEAEQTPPFELSKSTFKKAKNPNRTPMDSAKALAQKGMKTKTNEEVEQIEEGPFSSGVLKPTEKFKKQAAEIQSSGTYMGKDHKGVFTAKMVNHKEVSRVYHAKEEVEQIEEKSEEAYNHYKKQVLPIYKKHGLSPEFAKAVNNHVAKHGSYQVWNHHGDAEGQDPHWFDSEKQKVKSIKQKRGYEVSEEVEQIDEKLTASDSTSTWIHDFVHSNNKKFAGKSKEQRINMALGAKYAKEDFNFSEEEQAPLFKRVGSLSKIVEAAYKRQPVGVKIHYTHPEKKATYAQHFSASDAASGEKEMAAQGYKVKKRELMYGKVGM